MHLFYRKRGVYVSRAFVVVVAAIAPVLGSAPAFAQNAYITNYGSNSVSVIATSSNTVTATIPVGSVPVGVAVNPDGSKVYVANVNSNDVSMIETSSNTVIATIPVGSSPYAFGEFIQPGEPPAIFAGTPGDNTCHSQRVGALDTEFGSLKTAADALGFSSVRAL